MPSAFADTLEACLSADSLRAAEATLTACQEWEAKPHISPATRADILTQIGVAHRNLGQLAESEASLLEAVSLASDDASILRMLAWTYRETGNLEKAEQLYTQSLSLAAHWQGFLSRCVVRLDKQDYRAASGDCQMARNLRLDGDSVYFSAVAENKLGNHQLALQIALSGLNLSDTTPRVYAEAINAHRALGQTGRARILLNEGLLRWPEAVELLQLQ